MDQPADSGISLTIDDAKGTVTLKKSDDPLATVTHQFTRDGDNRLLTIESRKPDGWTLVDVLPWETDPVLDEIVFDTTTTLRLDTSKDAQGNDSLTSLTINGQAALSGETFNEIGGYLPLPTTQPLSGAITFDKGLPVMNLAPPAADPAAKPALVAVGLLQLAPIAVSLQTTAAWSMIRGQYQLQCRYSFASKIGFDAGGKTYPVPLSATIAGPGSDVILRADVNDMIQASMDALEGFLHLDDLGPVTNALNGNGIALDQLMKLEDLEVSVRPSDSSIVYIQTGVRSARKFTLIENQSAHTSIDLEDIYFSLTYFLPRDQQPSKLYAHLGCTIDLGGGQIQVAASLPDFTFHAWEVMGTTILLPELISTFAGSTNSEVPDLEVAEFDLTITPGKEYSGSIDLFGEWPLDFIPKAGVIITDMQFAVDYNQVEATFEATVGGALTLGGVDFTILAHHPASGGWQFSGKAGEKQPIMLGELITNLAKAFGFTKDMPESIRKLELADIEITFDTATKDFTFTIDTRFPIDGKELDAVIRIAITHNNGAYEREFSGVITIDGMEFDLVFDQKPDVTIFLAAYENKAGTDQSIAVLLATVTDNKDILAAAEGITINLKDALMVVDKGTATCILFGMDIGGGLDVSNLPLVGKLFPADSTVRATFQPLVTNQDFATADLAPIRALVPAGGFRLPDAATERLGFNIQLMIGQEVIDLSRLLPIGANDVKSQPPTTPASTSATTLAAGASATSIATTTAAPPSSADGVKWFVIQKQLGPVTFGRVGIQFLDSQLYFLLDASLTLAGLTISLDGLFVSSKLSPIQPAFGLHGLGINYQNGPLQIAGAFLRQTLKDAQGNAYDTYDGTVIIRTEEFALAALGSYAYYQGHPSLFVYAFMDVPLGGPAFFFVTGLAAGFGYNRRLVQPALDSVKSFPLVAEAIAGVPGAPNDLAGELARLHDVIPPSVGDYFLAVGIRFTSFEIMDSFLLLTVSFGSEFEVDVLGLSTLVIPTPDEGNAVEPLAEIQLALQAVFNPGRGYLKVRAGLTSDSFILSRACHLTGEFAFFTWFKDSEGAAAGEFVLTLGGYHPKFAPPVYYPKVAPLGFNWQVTDELLIKGDFYFALVPTAVMAGGHLSATWTSGNLQAWFRMGIDFIISWKPYFYSASSYLDMGVSYTFELFGTQHISVDVGTNLDIWGPDFSGRAHIHLWIVTFDVAFGAAASAQPAKLDWSQFRQSFLPANDKWASVSVAGGLIKQVGKDDDPLYIINPKEFALSAGSALPITKSGHGLAGINTTIAIGSMQITDSVTTEYNATIYHTDGSADRPVTDRFTFVPTKKNVPGAVWGPKFTHDATGSGEDALVKNVCMGFTITGTPALPSDQTFAVDREALLNEPETFDQLIAFSSPQTLSLEWLKPRSASQKDTEGIEARAPVRYEFLATLGFTDMYYPNKELVDEFILSAA